MSNPECFRHSFGNTAAQWHKVIPIVWLLVHTLRLGIDPSEDEQKLDNMEVRKPVNQFVRTDTQQEMKFIKLALFSPNVPSPANMIQAQRSSWDINVLIVILTHIRQGVRKTCDGVIAWIRDSTRKSPSVPDECSEHFHPKQPETQRYAHRSLPNET